MYRMVLSSAIVGMGSFLVRVEVDVSSGLPGFDIVGMVSGEVKEAKERVRVALKNIGIMMPPKKITVNLSPANVRKTGTAFDLPLIIGILAALEIIPADILEETLFMGEIGLDGEIKFVRGVMPSALMARKMGIKRCVVPKVNEAEGSVIDGIEVVGFSHLTEIIECLNTGVIRPDGSTENADVKRKSGMDYDFSEDGLLNSSGEDFKDVYGQEGVKRVAKIAAAGFHHFMMVGPPGAGKSMIAKRMPSILPPLTMEESLEISQIYSIKGLLSEEKPLILQRPFCSPHHTVTKQAMTGGGYNVLPGIISMAHRGVLFLDEAPHFSGEVIEVLRQPLEDKKVEVSRISGSFSFPADFMLILACNPCPCGYYPDRNKCRCSEYEIKRYRAKLSGPILDRIDLSISASKISINELKGIGKKPESSSEMREKIMIARQMQKERFKDCGRNFNSELDSSEILDFCRMEPSAQRLLENAFEKLSLSARGYHKILKVARTIADLEESELIREAHIAEAIGYRVTDAQMP